MNTNLAEIVSIPNQNHPRSADARKIEAIRREHAPSPGNIVHFVGCVNAGRRAP